MGSASIFLVNDTRVVQWIENMLNEIWEVWNWFDFHLVMDIKFIFAFPSRHNLQFVLYVCSCSILLWCVLNYFMNVSRLERCFYIIVLPFLFRLHSIPEVVCSGRSCMPCPAASVFPQRKVQRQVENCFYKIPLHFHTFLVNSVYVSA